MLSSRQKEAIRLLELDPTISDVLYGGAAGGGKSFLGCFWQISRRLFHPETTGLIGRDSLINLKNTTLTTFVRVWGKYFAANPSGITIKPDGQRNVIHFSNGSYIYLKGLAYNSSDPEFTDLGSLELTDAFIDEVNGCSKKGVDIVSSRIRHRLINDKSPILMAANPGYDWVRDRFIRERDGSDKMLQPHEAVVTALLSDNPDPEFRRQYKRQLEKLPPYDRDRLLLGDWDAVEQVDNPFLHAFDTLRHVGDVAHNNNLPIIISIDFNINPFCAIFAQQDGRKFYIYDEVSIDKGDLQKMASVILSKVPRNKMSMVKITGDAMGKRGEVAVRNNSSNYQQLASMLGLHYSSFYLPANPTHSNSRADCNAALQQLDVKISTGCTGLISDCKRVRVDSTGAIVKSNRKVIEQRSDFLDCFRYLINTFAKKELR